MNFKKKNQQRGLSIIEAVVATVIISIGFVSIIKSVNSSVQTVISSGYQSKVSHLMAMVAEDLLADANSDYLPAGVIPTSSTDTKLYENDDNISLRSQCSNSTNDYTSLVNKQTLTNKLRKWSNLFNRVIPCTAITEPTVKITKMTGSEIYLALISVTITKDQKDKILYAPIYLLQE